VKALIYAIEKSRREEGLRQGPFSIELEDVYLTEEES